MRILFDKERPCPFAGPCSCTRSRRSSSYCRLVDAVKRSNGELLAEAEGQFELLITTDRNIRYRQHLSGRRLALLVLPTTNWPQIQRHTVEIERAVASIKPGEYRELSWSE